MVNSMMRQKFYLLDFNRHKPFKEDSIRTYFRSANVIHNIYQTLTKLKQMILKLNIFFQKKELKLSIL
jgi:hypothetical protein